MRKSHRSISINYIIENLDRSTSYVDYIIENLDNLKPYDYSDIINSEPLSEYISRHSSNNLQEIIEITDDYWLCFESRWIDSKDKLIDEDGMEHEILDYKEEHFSKKIKLKIKTNGCLKLKIGDKLYVKYG